MKILIAPLVLFCATCAPASVVRASKCPSEGEVSITFLESFSVGANRYGRFRLRNSSAARITLPLARDSPSEIYARNVEPLVKIEGGSWESFNPLLDELPPPKSTLTVAQDQQGEFSFDMNGAFLPANERFTKGREFALSVVSSEGCTFQSTPFRPIE